MSALIIQAGKLKGKRLVLPEKEVLVGRDEGCQVRLASSLVSRKHCGLTKTAEGIWVRDFDTPNKTFVNNAAIIEPTLLKPGDLLRIGAVEFLVVVEKQAAAEAQPEAAEGGVLSDDDIAHWLTDDELPAAGTSDTTIVTGAAPTSSELQSSAETKPPGTPPSKKKYLSVAEEAADIIRRHWAATRDQESQLGSRGARDANPGG